MSEHLAWIILYLNRTPGFRDLTKLMLGEGNLSFGYDLSVFFAPLSNVCNTMCKSLQNINNHGAYSFTILWAIINTELHKPDTRGGLSFHIHQKEPILPVEQTCFKESTLPPPLIEKATGGETSNIA